MKTTFQRIYTEDNLELSGLLYEPDIPTKTAVAHVHGMAGNFYENKFVDFIAKTLTNNGIAFCPFNNRGAEYIEDVIVLQKDGYTTKWIGETREKFSDCVLDIKAHLDFLSQSGFETIHLQGHSLGCVKAIYYLSKTQDKRVASLIIISPPDMLGLVRTGEEKQKFSKFLEKAKQMVKEGKGNDLMPWMVWGEYPISANTYLDLFGDNSEAGVFNFYKPHDEFKMLSSIKVPIVALMGRKDDSFTASIEKTFELIKNKAKSSPRVETKIIGEALHSYRGHEQQLADAILDWVKSFK
ncbi:MAG: alpha/beta fold hydrolase [Patescibacteria group bacterium]